MEERFLNEAEEPTLFEEPKTEEVSVEVVPRDELDKDEKSPIVKFKKTYTFERVEYTEVDLSGIEDLTGRDVLEINRKMSAENPGIDIMPEITMEYAFHLASKATKLPFEFFLGLPIRECLKVKNRVMGFSFG